MNVIGIDIGTTNCKVCLMNVHELRLLDLYRFRTPKLVTGDKTDFDVDNIWEELKVGIQKVVKNQSGTRVMGISIASVGEAGVLLDSEGNRIGPCIAWYDSRGGEHVDELINEMGASRLYNITGIPAHSNYSVAKIKWLQNNYPQARKTGVQWLHVANYFAFKLTGVRRMEYSLTSRTLAFDLKRNDWSDDILGQLGLDSSMFPEVLAAGEIIGELALPLADEFGLTDRPIVSVAGHDHMAGSLITSLESGTELLNSTGTTEGLLAIQNHPILTEESYEAKLSNGIYVREGMYSYFGSIPSAGSAIEWIRKILGLEDQYLFDEVINRVYQKYLENQMNLDMFFVPHLKGSGPPTRSKSAKGIVYGLTVDTDKDDLVFALFLGMCLELKNLYLSFQKLTKNKVEVVKVIGPANRNPLWLQLKADVLGCEIQPYEMAEAVAGGAASLLALKQKWVDHLEGLPCSGMEKSYFPDTEKNVLIERLFEKKYEPLLKMKSDWK